MTIQEWAQEAREYLQREETDPFIVDQLLSTYPYPEATTEREKSYDVKNSTHTRRRAIG